MTLALELVLHSRLVAILRMDDLACALPLSRALLDAGIVAQEFTLTNPRALQAVRSVLEGIEAFSNGQATIGVGSIRSRQQAMEAIAAGAHFLVSPTFCPSVVACCNEHHVPVFSGAMTPTEIAAAWEAGAALVKVFPARTLGPSYIKDVLAPMPEIKLMPTGGVDLKNMQQYYAAGAVAVGVGGNLLDMEAIAIGDWQRVAERAREYSHAAGQRQAC